MATAQVHGFASAEATNRRLLVLADLLLDPRWEGAVVRLPPCMFTVVDAQDANDAAWPRQAALVDELLSGHVGGGGSSRSSPPPPQAHTLPADTIVSRRALWVAAMAPSLPADVVRRVDSKQRLYMELFTRVSDAMQGWIADAVLDAEDRHGSGGESDDSSDRGVSAADVELMDGLMLRVRRRMEALEFSIRQQRYVLCGLCTAAWDANQEWESIAQSSKSASMAALTVSPQWRPLVVFDDGAVTLFAHVAPAADTTDRTPQEMGAGASCHAALPPAQWFRYRVLPAAAAAAATRVGDNRVTKAERKALRRKLKRAAQQPSKAWRSSATAAPATASTVAAPETTSAAASAAVAAASSSS